ncbi:MAG: hypothetical protein WAK41_20520, partial [Roseiarcus sp.]|uniref:hypothetical protein n=1 Tax=Roseiarcus sp. TaxID=1969460 RepID=UPI003BB0CEB6
LVVGARSQKIPAPRGTFTAGSRSPKPVVVRGRTLVSPGGLQWRKLLSLTVVRRQSRALSHGISIPLC